MMYWSMDAIKCRIANSTLWFNLSKALEKSRDRRSVALLLSVAVKKLTHFDMVFTKFALHKGKILNTKGVAKVFLQSF